MHWLRQAAQAVPRLSRLSFAALAVVACLCAPSAFAQSLLTAKPAPSASAARANGAHDEKTAQDDETETPDSPRASMSQFLELTRASDFAGAAKYLDVPKQRESDGPELARRLIAVLDRYDWIDLDRISPKSTGALDDGLPSSYESLGTVPGPTSTPQPVRLVKQGGTPGKWVFTKSTVQRIDTWYENLPDRWFLEHLPATLLRAGPRGMLWWQWIALPVMLLASILVGVIAGWTTRKILHPIVKRTPAEWDDALLERLGGPIALALGLAFAWVVVPELALYEPAQVLFTQVLRGGVLFDFFWALSRIMDVGARLMSTATWARQRHASLPLIKLLARVGKVVVVAFAVIAFLSELGYSVTSVIAGLGVGGLAIALAAQKTVENLFGAFSIGADQPFREGDFIKVDDVSGTVESIGLRSTRIRTLDRTIITMPNGKLADSRVESISARDRIRFVGSIGLVRNTSTAATKYILAAAERIMKGHAKVWPDGIVARLAEIKDTSLTIELTCWFQTSDFGEFQSIRHEVLLAVMKVIEEAPARAVASDPPPPREGGAEPPPDSGSRTRPNEAAGT